MLRLKANFLTLLVGAAFAFFLGEMLVRVFAPQQLISLRPDIWVADSSGLGWKLKPSLDIRVNLGERNVRLLTDEKGHRTGRGSAENPDVRMEFMGEYKGELYYRYDGHLNPRGNQAVAGYAAEKLAPFLADRS